MSTPASGAPRHVLLCGVSGSGKSTIGAAAARSLGRPFVDIDALVAQRVGMSVAAFFAAHGEPAFRAHERQAVIDTLASAQPHVIALGGGALEDDATLRDALEHTLVWLQTPLTRIISRLRGKADRPLLAGNLRERITTLAAAREPRYQQAHLAVEAVRSSSVITRTLVERIRAHEHEQADRVSEPSVGATRS